MMLFIVERTNGKLFMINYFLLMAEILLYLSAMVIFVRRSIKDIDPKKKKINLSVALALLFVIVIKFILPVII